MEKCIGSHVNDTTWFAYFHVICRSHTQLNIRLVSQLAEWVSIRLHVKMLNSKLMSNSGWN